MWLDDAINQQRMRYPGDPLGMAGPPGPPQRALEIPQGSGGYGLAPPIVRAQGEGAPAPTMGPPNPPWVGMNDFSRLFYDPLERPAQAIFGGKQGQNVAEVLSAVLPLIAAAGYLKYGLRALKGRPIDEVLDELGIPRGGSEPRMGSRLQRRTPGQVIDMEAWRRAHPRPPVEPPTAPTVPLPQGPFSEAPRFQQFPGRSTIPLGPGQPTGPLHYPLPEDEY